ncbi:MAG: helix-turn-helix domain-containing protein, partial [Anaerolineae bacterium]|nr:helix-turn-helix domain-containing protein [Anaerolineae bacterium]
LPTRLVGVNRQLEKNRLTQMETSAEINRRVGRILNRRQLSHEIANLIRDNYGYTRVQLYLWLQDKAVFMLEADDSEPRDRVIIPIDQSGILGEALQLNEPIFIPDTRYSHRFPPDPKQQEMRSRVVLPIRRGETVVGVLDMHSHHHTLHHSHELIGLQSLADQLGIAMHNADLYEDALQARAVAEKADQLKTRLLANVSHELRTPLNVILGYSQKALSTPNNYEIELPHELRRDISYIFQSCEHLTRLINDLLDLSRAEIDQLEIFPETISTRTFLEEVFHSIANTSGGKVKWQLAVPDRLPAIQADPVRLRQILLNLLSNASKFTSSGEIVLGVSVNPPHLHLWVQDTGLGIPVDLQDRIFEPFVTSQDPGHRREGIGLGLSITRRLVALHGGVMSLESRVGKGSTFHVYLPLPNLSGNFSAPPTELLRPVLLVLSTGQEVSQTLLNLAAERELPVRQARTPEQIELILKDNTPSILAWDMAEARHDEWALVDYIRAHPQLCLLPFIVYREAPGGDIQTTAMLVKPVAQNTIMEAINGLRPDWGGGPILIVDDEPGMCDLYKQIVNDAFPGYPTLAVENGAQAIASMQMTVPGLVILDLMMPEVDGFMVLEKMRSKPETRHVPVLVMSGKLLSMDDIKRLDYANVTFQSKGLLTSDETASLLTEILEPGETLPQPTSILVKATIAFLHQNYALPITRQDIADAVGVSSSYLSKIFREEVKLTTWDYLNRLRIRKAKELLETTTDTITSIATQVGFDDSAYFSRIFRKYTAQSPQSYRQQRS